MRAMKKPPFDGPRCYGPRCYGPRCFGRVASLLLLVALCGCDNEIHSDYGVRSGRSKSSVNGTTVFAEMFELAGFDVTSRSYISPRLNDFDVIVWAPDDFAPPSVAQRIGIENWLSEGGRTLIYIGRDYDALADYYQQARATAPAAQKVELWRREGFAKADFAAAREAIPHPAVTARWFTLHNRSEREQVTGLAAPNSYWLDGIDIEELDIEVQAYLAEPTEAEVKQALQGGKVGDASTATMNFDNSFEQFDFTDARRQSRAPQSYNVYLESASGTPLITEVQDPHWGDSRVLLIPNGSFLLNLPLINHEHRKLAQKLIRFCEGEHVGFLHTNADDRDVHVKREGETLPGLAAFTTWPLGIIIFHAFVLGVLLLFYQFPILGRPQGGPRVSTGDFGKHIQAIGRLLRRQGDSAHAQRALAKYRRQKDEATGATPQSQPESLL